MPQQSIGSTARTLSSTNTDCNPRQTGCLQLVTSYDTQDTLGLFYIPGPTGGAYQTNAAENLHRHSPCSPNHYNLVHYLMNLDLNLTQHSQKHLPPASSSKICYHPMTVVEWVFHTTPLSRTQTVFLPLHLQLVYLKAYKITKHIKHVQNEEEIKFNFYRCYPSQVFNANGRVHADY